MRSCPTCRRTFVDTQDACPLDSARLVAATGELPAGVGKKLGAYQLVCLLGEGGMGNIYIARHASLGRYVAIKTLRPELAKRKDNVARFFQEAHTINALKHPNIVESIDLVEDVDGAYCVLELLKGPDLKTRLARGPLPIASAIYIGIQLAQALGKVHAIGVVHRDLKPENLLLVERDGRNDFVKLIDFGIAQIGDHGASVAGTAAYMAPEQGVTGASVDRRADIYSLGVILFEMVCGRHPFPCETDSAYLIAHADTKVPRPSKLNRKCPPALEAVILKCMEKQPEARFASAEQVSAALRMVDPHTTSGTAGVIAAAVMLAAAAGAASFFLVPKYLAKKSVAAAAAPSREPAAPPAPAPAPVEPAPPAAPPAEPVQTAAPAAVQPTFVDIAIVSTPEGVSVYRVGETVALGVTPFTAALPRSDKPVAMRFEKTGFESKTLEVSVEGSLEVQVSLAKQRESVARGQPVQKRKPAPTAPRTDKPKSKQGVQREGVMDPFANP
jgi:eukaryotic-like serine/threonine-protein kinase